MSDIPDDVMAIAAKVNMSARVQSSMAEQAAVVARAIMAERERCAAICERERDAFLSTEYAANQPLGSFCERFACDVCAEAIRKGVP